jgi:hypothetical protein
VAKIREGFNFLCPAGLAALSGLILQQLFPGGNNSRKRRLTVAKKAACVRMKLSGQAKKALTPT